MTHQNQDVLTEYKDIMLAIGKQSGYRGLGYMASRFETATGVKVSRTSVRNFFVRHGFIKPIPSDTKAHKRVTKQIYRQRRNNAST